MTDFDKLPRSQRANAYRDRAAQAENLAARSNDDLRVVCLMMARQWRDLADWAEKTAGEYAYSESPREDGGPGQARATRATTGN